jgi:UDP-3-O-[3-hydroxymyristoyl] glucosamine N-acyltransferase
LVDDRFFRRSGPFALSQIAAHVGGELAEGAPMDFMVRGVAPLENAEAGDISIFSEAKWAGDLETTGASVIVTNERLSGRVPAGKWTLIVTDPRYAFAKIGHLIHPGPEPVAGVDPTAKIGRGTQIEPGVVIRANVVIGARCLIDCNAVIGDGVIMGDDCRVGANTLVTHTIMADRVRIFPNSTVGGEGFGFVAGAEGPIRVAQLGRVMLHNDVRIGANCSVDRGAMGDTVIGNGTVLDNLIHIGHNVQIGRYCALAAQTGIAGSTTVGDFVMMGGQVGISDHRTIGSAVRLAAKSGVIHDVPSGQTWGGYPAVPVRIWHRQTLATSGGGRTARKKNAEPSG